MSSKELEQYINEMSDRTNKALIALNSGAIFSTIAFHSQGCLTQKTGVLIPFVIGITCILFTYALNYFQGVHALYRPEDLLNNINWYPHLATFFAVMSALSFLWGVWSIALFL